VPGFKHRNLLARDMLDIGTGWLTFMDFSRLYGVAAARPVVGIRISTVLLSYVFEVQHLCGF